MKLNSLVYIVVAVLVTLAGWLGWAGHKKFAGPDTPAFSAPETLRINLTQHQTDSIRAVVNSEFRVTKRSLQLEIRRLENGRLDTVIFVTNDSSEIAGYQTIIADLVAQNNQLGTIITDTPQVAQKPAKQAYLRAGLGLQAPISKDFKLIPTANLFILNHLSTIYGYNFKDNQHIAGVGWTF